VSTIRFSDGRWGSSSRWEPADARPQWTTPEPGALVGWDHAVWRVMRVRAMPEEKWREEYREYVLRFGDSYAPVIVVLRPAQHDSPDPVAARRHDQHVSGVPGKTTWHVYRSEHYPVCVRCQEPLPCRELYAEAVARHEVAELSRYELGGVCPACGEVVSARQKSLTFPNNVMIPGGPPLTYHTRSRCHWQAMRYEDRWVAADPERRRSSLSCPGLYTQHGDNTYDCSEFGECRGPQADHRGGYAQCRCPDCHATGSFVWRPRRSRPSRRNDLAG
jgi:hypothetical protein